MTLGNMRANGVRSLDVSCLLCHHRAILSADPWPDHVPVPTFGPRMVCTRCRTGGNNRRGWPMSTWTFMSSNITVAPQKLSTSANSMALEPPPRSAFICATL
jgi:hypothetical protein